MARKRRRAPTGSSEYQADGGICDGQPDPSNIEGSAISTECGLRMRHCPCFSLLQRLELDVSGNGRGMAQSPPLSSATLRTLPSPSGRVVPKNTRRFAKIEIQKSITTLTQPPANSTRTKLPVAVANWLPRKTSIVVVLHLIHRNNTLHSAPTLLTAVLSLHCTTAN